MAPLRIPKVTEVSSCSPIASGDSSLSAGHGVGINVSNTTTSTNQELVGGFNPFEKYESKWEIIPK